MTMVTIRKADRSDAAAIAHVHVRAWAESYQDLAPQEVLDSLNQTTREKQWSLGLSREDGWPLVFVAEVTGAIIGFVAVSPSSAQERDFHPHPIVRTLYLLNTHKGRGIGRRLMVKAARALETRGLTSLALGVLVDNAPAIAFYEHLGGRRAGLMTSPGPVWQAEEYVYVWDDLGRIMATNE